jgi:hypothetical protein
METFTNTFLTSTSTSLTGNEDTDLYILSMMDDVDIENLCDSNVQIHHLCLKMWVTKIKLLYPDFPVLHLDAMEYKALYYKLKNNKWSDVVVWAEVNNINLLSQWIIKNTNYKQYIIKTINNYYRGIDNVNRKKNKISITMSLFKFIITHRQFINSDYPQWKKFKIAIINKLIELRDTEPELYDVFNSYINYLLN